MCNLAEEVPLGFKSLPKMNYLCMYVSVYVYICECICICAFFLVSVAEIFLKFNILLHTEKSDSIRFPGWDFFPQS